MNVRTGSVGGLNARIESGVLRIVRVAMKCFDPYQTTNGESTMRATTDAKGRNRGEQNGLDTQVVRGVNYVYRHCLD